MILAVYKNGQNHSVDNLIGMPPKGDRPYKNRNVTFLPIACFCPAPYTFLLSAAWVSRTDVTILNPQPCTGGSLGKVS